MAASNLPIPIPPRTPTPPSDDEPSSAGLGVEGLSMSPPKIVFDENSLSPMVDTFPFHSNHGHGHGHTHGHHPSTSSNLSINPLSPSLYGSLSESTNNNASEGNNGPFNFQPTVLAKSPVIKSGIGQRRGHKYKHSSVSHQIFLEPPPRAPLALPNSLPIPTFKECKRSMSVEQKTRFWWSVCHMLVAGYTLWSAQGSLALTALSHLILYDSLGALVCVTVDVLCNFEVWSRSSIRHPFGLARAEVLAGFAMSVLLLFMGMDLISHNLTHLLESLHDHEPHRTHPHSRISAGSVDLASLLAIIATLISAFGLKNHARIGKALQFTPISTLPSLLSNPSHLLTLSCSGLLLILPLLSIEMYNSLDKVISFTAANFMCILGFRLAKVLGSMLLMSAPTGSENGTGIADLLRDIQHDPCVMAVEDAKVWQVHYGLCMANFKLRVKRSAASGMVSLGSGSGSGSGSMGMEENFVRLRDKISSLVRNRLGGGYGSGRGQKWEVSTQLTIEQA
ncbi:MAG: Endoplasmic reticulum zinc transporter [Cirrosporium novae-zelandiae]|nr:MAG: Endoplasmic reticulum zinc transporter [Cirrosporium novae-zelandiae]